MATPNGPYCTFYGDQTPKNELVKACVGSIKANGYALTLSDPIQFHSHIIRRPTDAVGGVFKQLATPNGPYCTFYGDQTPKNELVKTCVGSIKANVYALTLSDPIQCPIMFLTKSMYHHAKFSNTNILSKSTIYDPNNQNFQVKLPKSTSANFKDIVFTSLSTINS